MIRFKPVRAGIIGVWDYTVQEFRFADGRLVLRGPNGSGKTKALELLVPFVLDGSTDARRLDPFSGKDRTMQSNLLYGGDKARRGYCWMEFRRGDEVATIGVGLRAQENARLTTWFFVTDRVVGESLPLVDDQRIPMTRKAMRGLLGDEQCFDTRDAHRQAVNRRLFGFDGERYESMIELVLTLRRPQLAKELDPETLSDVLSAGLRTVDPDLLRDSAQAFDDLEATQRDLSELERADQAVAELVTTWRTYLRTRARQRLVDVEEKARRVRETEGEVNELSRDIDALRDEVAAHGRRVVEAENRTAAATAVIEGLKQRDAYRNQGALDDARRLVQKAQEVRDATLAEFEKRQAAAKRDQRALEVAVERHRKALADVASARSALVTHCELAQVHVGELVEVDAVRVDLLRQQVSVAEVLDALKALEGRETARDTAEAALQQRIAELEVAAAALEDARLALGTATEARTEAIVAWYTSLSDVLRDRLDLASLREAAPAADDRPDVLAVVNDAWHPLNEALLTERADREREARAHQERIEEIDALIREIQAERDDAPPKPTTRAATRTDRPGAPLWRLVRFADPVPPEERAALEGALLASGLLDAWVDPDEPEQASRDDTHLRASSAVAVPSLLDVLVPEDQDAVPARRVEAVLRGVSLVDAEVRIGRDGTFALGPLAGAHHPDRARYIGATARRQHREERVAGLRTEREAEDSKRLEAASEGARLTKIIDELKAARSAVPSDTAVRRARGEVTSRLAVAQDAEQRRVVAQRQRDNAERERAEAELAFRRAAVEHGLPVDRAALRALEQSVARAADALKSYVTAHDLCADREVAVEEARVRHDDAVCELDDAELAASRAAGTHDAENTRYTTLQSTLGAEVLAVQRQIDRAEAERDAALADRRSADRDKEASNTRLNQLIGRLGTLEDALPARRADFEAATASLDPFRTPAVAITLAVADGDAPFADRLAAQVEGAASTPERLKATETQLNNRLAELDDALGARFHHVHRTDDGVVVVSIVDEEGESDVIAFQRRNAERLDRVRDLLVEREQKVFEEHLLTSLISRLRDRIDETRELAAAMDRAMRARKLASGKHVGVRWRHLPDADATRRELLSLLEFEPAFLSIDKLERMRALLSDEVQAERRDNPDRTYLQILMRALDYRAWHRFELYLYDASGGKKRLNRSTHGLLSGGEKAATVHLPLFAAAHAHFGAANPDCPRLIALDEAFAGIDETGTPELLRLAVEFDLDWFLTGHNLWVTEPFLPAVMHYDLAHDEATRAVSAWPILWNGHETIEGDAA